MILVELITWLVGALGLAAIGSWISFSAGWKAGFKAGNLRAKLFARLKRDEFHGRN
jgi:hypothetical protein